LAKKWRFLLELLLVFAQKLIVTLVLEKNAFFCAETLQNSPKIVIITSIPGRNLRINIGQLFILEILHQISSKLYRQEKFPTVVDKVL
jgi:hypothetical protein